MLIAVVLVIEIMSVHQPSCSGKMGVSTLALEKMSVKGVARA